MVTIKTDIERLKKQLIKKAQKGGLYENFGDKEVRKLQDKYPRGYMSQERINMDLIEDFSKWARTFDDRQLLKLKRRG